MTRFAASLFIARREAIPHDGSRLLVAGGRVEHQDAEARAADDRLAASLATALDAVPVADAGHRTRTGQQQGGEPQ